LASITVQEDWGVVDPCLPRFRTDLKRPAGHSLEGRAPVAMHITTIALVLFVEFEARQRGTIPVRGGGKQLFGLEARLAPRVPLPQGERGAAAGKRLWSGPA